MVLLTSAPDARACFVYITLPGQTTAVTAGTYRLLTSAAGEMEGQFRYDCHYLERRDAVEIDPVKLVLTRENLLSACGSFQLTKEDAERIVDGMTLAVAAGWHAAVRAAGVTEADAEKIRMAFVCPGFGARASKPRLHG